MAEALHLRFKQVRFTPQRTCTTPLRCLSNRQILTKYSTYQSFTFGRNGADSLPYQHSPVPSKQKQTHQDHFGGMIIQPQLERLRLPTRRVFSDEIDFAKSRAEQGAHQCPKSIALHNVVIENINRFPVQKVHHLHAFAASALKVRASGGAHRVVALMLRCIRPHDQAPVAPPLLDCRVHARTTRGSSPHFHGTTPFIGARSEAGANVAGKRPSHDGKITNSLRSA